MERLRSLILAKIEGTYGVDSDPAAATEAIITITEPKFSIVNNAKVRNVSLGYFGTLAPIQVGEALKITFATEIKGSGTAGTVSRRSALYQACGFTETINAGASVAYALNSDIVNIKSATLYFYHGGTLHKMLGCVGTWKTTLKTNEMMIEDWEFTGLYSSAHATDIAFPTPTFTTIAPIIFNGANFKYNAISNLVIEQLMLDLGNVVSKHVDANATEGISSYFISDRKAKGSINPEKIALATLNPWTIFDTSTQEELESKPTGTAGNLIEIVANGVTLDPPQYNNREKIINWDLSFTLNPTLTTGNNEIQLTFK